MVVYFVTAIGTNIGKTHFCCNMLNYWHNKSYDVYGIKPIISGFDEKNLKDTDSYKLLQSINVMADMASMQAISPWRYKEPLSPDMAARHANDIIEYQALLNFCNTYINNYNNYPNKLLLIDKH